MSKMGVETVFCERKDCVPATETSIDVETTGLQFFKRLVFSNRVSIFFCFIQENMICWHSKASHTLYENSLVHQSVHGSALQTIQHDPSLNWKAVKDTDFNNKEINRFKELTANAQRSDSAVR